jgi:hypothetical protein
MKTEVKTERDDCVKAVQKWLKANAELMASMRWVSARLRDELEWCKANHEGDTPADVEHVQKLSHLHKCFGLITSHLSDSEEESQEAVKISDKYLLLP